MTICCHAACPRRRLVAIEDTADWLRAKLKSHMPLNTALIRSSDGALTGCELVKL